MNERERLIELLNDMQDKGYVQARNEDEISCHVSNEKLADAIIADGWMRPLCKPSDILYTIESCKNNPEKLVVIAVYQYEKYTFIKALSRNQTEYFYEDEDFGKIVYFTKEEAEQALRKEDEGK